MDILIDLYQQGRIVEAQNRAEAASDRAKRLQRDVDDLKRKADALTIACQALWEIVRSHLRLTDQGILQKMQEIDLRDGKADGKISHQTVSCPRCARTNSSTRQICLYCGTRVGGGNVFEKV